MIKWSRSWPDQWEGLPVDVLPCSNEEYAPAPPTKGQLTAMHLQDREVERWRRKFNMDRRTFVRTSAAMAIGFWALDAAMPGKWGTFAAAHNTETTDACDLEWAGRNGLETLQNLPGEFVFDIQSHHVEPLAPWRVTNPAIVAFFAAIWPQASPVLGGRPKVRQDGSIRGGGAGELDPIENLSRFHYMKELYLDSATTMTVLSCVPTSPDTNNPLPLADAAMTVDTANGMAKSQRAILHAFVMPNRGGAGMSQDQLIDPTKAVTGKPGPDPIFFEDEMNLMEERARHYGDILGGWKTYCAWGDVPYASGWWLDSDYGMRFLANVKRLSDLYGIPPVVATHKGFSLPGFDQRGASPRDVGPAAKANPDVRFMIYHSGYDIFQYNGVPVGGEQQQDYAGDAAVNSSDRTVDAFIKSLRENNWDASHFVEPGKTFGNVPNVWAELGSVWRDQLAMGGDGCVHLLGKLIKHVGPKRIAWGTDSLWYGSPQQEIVGLRRLEFTQQAKDHYGLPYGLDGDVEDPTKPAPSPDRTIRNGILGRNAAEAYNIDPDAQRNAIHCDSVNAIRQDYVKGLGDPLKERAPLASNTVIGPRTRRQVLRDHFNGEWTP